MAQEGLLLTVTHTGLNSSSIVLADVSDGTQDPSYRRPGAVYVPVGGSITLDYTSTVAMSFETGDIRGFITGGYLTAAFLIGPTLQAALGGAPGDLPETRFAAANNQVAPADVTGFAFDTTVVRSFDALVSVFVNAAAPLYANFILRGIQKNGSWDMTTTVTGDVTGLVFTITAAGQIQYTSTNIAAWANTDVVFRAITTSV